MNATTSTTKPTDRWQQLKLRDNPFKSLNATTETEEDLSGCFVDIGGISIDDLLASPDPCLIAGDRGSGKTACRRTIAMRCWPTSAQSTVLCVEYTPNMFKDYSNVEDVVMKPVAHARAIISGAVELFQKNADRLPHKMRPSLGTTYLNAFDTLSHFTEKTSRSGFDRRLCLIDGIDEYLPGTPGKMAEFLLPLLERTELLIDAGISFRFFLPKQVMDEPAIKNNPKVRLDLMRRYEIEWSKPDLKRLVRQRLAYYSIEQTKPLQEIGELCEEELGGRIDNEIVDLAFSVAMHTRALIELARRLFENHLEHAESGSLISQSAWDTTGEWFSKRAADFGPPLVATIQACKFQLRDNQISFDDRVIPLSGISSLLLKRLIEAKGSLVTRSELIKAAWPDITDARIISPDTFKKAISRLKGTLKGSGVDENHIQAVPGQGYRLNTSLD